MTVRTLSLAEFEAAYAKRSGISIEILHEYGRYAQPCDCGDDMCEGWQMGHRLQDAIRADLARMLDNEAVGAKRKREQ